METIDKGVPFVVDTREVLPEEGVGVMGVHKEREAFEEKMCHKLVGVFDNALNCYVELTDQLMWETWQTAKAQSVPEGFVLVPKDLIKTLHEELLDHEPDSFVVNRDICELWRRVEAQEPSYD